MAQPVLETDDYYCSDLVLDDSHGYFTILRVPDDTDDEDGSSQPTARGIGFGRFELANPSNVETLRTGIDTVGAGARRLYKDGDTLYAVDPNVIVKIDKGHFDGRRDF
jgi:hypothetical protein